MDSCAHYARVDLLPPGILGTTMAFLPREAQTEFSFVSKYCRAISLPHLFRRITCVFSRREFEKLRAFPRLISPPMPCVWSTWCRILYGAVRLSHRPGHALILMRGMSGSYLRLSKQLVAFVRDMCRYPTSGPRKSTRWWALSRIFARRFGSCWIMRRCCMFEGHAST